MQFPVRNKQGTVAEDDYREWSSGDEGTDANASDSQNMPLEVFQFSGIIEETITELEGAVFPKLNWSCPKDAAWIMSGNSLRCSSADEVLLLLKSSDRAMYDIESALQDCVDEVVAGQSPAGLDQVPLLDGRVLALRKWHDLKPGREFRCFVYEHKIIGK